MQDGVRNSLAQPPSKASCFHRLGRSISTRFLHQIFSLLHRDRDQCEPLLGRAPRCRIFHISLCLPDKAEVKDKTDPRPGRVTKSLYCTIPVRSWLGFSNPFDEDVIFLSMLTLAFYINYFKLIQSYLEEGLLVKTEAKRGRCGATRLWSSMPAVGSRVGHSGKGLQMYAVGLALSFINQIWKACLEWTHRRPFGISDEAAGG
jgi:hypothetical protein